MKNMKRTIAVLVAVSLMIGCAIGGTMAWLTSGTDPVVNTFTVSDVDIMLTETDPENDDNALNNSYQMIPGWTIDKDPVVTVKAGSEDCYVFLKVTENIDAGNYSFDDFIAYQIDEHNWTQLNDANNQPIDGVYYCKATAIGADRAIKVLGPGSYTDPMDKIVTGDEVTVTWTNNQVAVKPSVTKEMMEAANGSQPTLTFKACAVQLMKNNTTEFTVTEAWGNAPEDFKN